MFYFMKKLILLFSVGMGFILNSNAQLLFNETFNYSSSTLASVAGDPATDATNNLTYVWYKSGKTSDSNSGSFSFSDPLFYTDYITSGVGKSVVIDNAGAGTNTRVDVVRFVPNANKFALSTASSNAYAGYLYYSFMITVNDATSYSTSGGTEGTDWRDVFCIAEGGSDVLGNSFRGRFFIKQDATDPALIDYSICKNTSFSSTTPPDNSGTFPKGQNCLVVIRQNFIVDATTNPTGTVEVIVNPTISATEPTSGWINGKPSDTNTFGGTYGVAIRRRNLGSTANIQIGGLRVAKTWNDVLYGTLSGVKNPSVDNNIWMNGKNIMTQQKGMLKVYNLSGAELISAQTEGSLATTLAKGVYLVRFNGNDGSTNASKILIQ